MAKIASETQTDLRRAFKKCHSVSNIIKFEKALQFKSCSNDTDAEVFMNIQ